MAFVLDLEPTYKWPVAVELPGDGKFRRFTFEVIFNRLSQSRFEEILLEQQEAETELQGKATKKRKQELLANQRTLAMEVLAGWQGVKAHDGDADDVPFTSANVARFLEVPGMAKAIFNALGESLGNAKEKN